MFQRICRQVLMYNRLQETPKQPAHVTGSLGNSKKHSQREFITENTAEEEILSIIYGGEINP